MRASYLRGVWNLALRRHEPLLLPRLALRGLGARLPLAGTRLAGPLQAAFVLTHRCPCRCAFCEVPAREGDGAMDLAGKRAVVQGLARLGVLAVTLTGGEPVLDPNLPELVTAASREGLYVHLSTTGWGLDDPARAATLLAAGLDGVTISVNGAGEDGVRPWPGALEALRVLADAAARARRPLTLATTTVLDPRDLDGAEAAVRAVLDQGLARAGVMPLHDPSDPAAFAGRVARLEALARTLADWKRRTGRVDNSYRYLAALARTGRADPLPVRCLAPRTSLLVDTAGRLYPCAPEWLAHRPVARAEGGAGLADAWASAEAAAAVRRLRDCRACLWNCHAETSFALDPLGPVREARALMDLGFRRKVRP